MSDHNDQSNLPTPASQVGATSPSTPAPAPDQAGTTPRDGSQATPETPAPAYEATGVDLMTVDPFRDSMIKDGFMSAQPRNATPAAREAAGAMGRIAPSAQPASAAPAAPASTPFQANVPSASPAGAPGELSETAQLKAQLAALQERINQAPQEAPAAPAAPPAGQIQFAEDPGLNGVLNQLHKSFTVPDSLLQALQSNDDDVARQGMLAVMQAVSMQTARAMHDYIGQTMTQVDRHISNTVQTYLHAFTVFQDFYSRYPALNNDKLHPMVMQISNEVRKEMGVKPGVYTAQLAQEIARRAYATLGWTLEAQGAQGRTPSEPTPNTSHQSPHFFSGGSRPSGNVDPATAMANSLGLSASEFEPPRD